MAKKTLIVRAGINQNALLREVSRIPVLNAVAEYVDNGFDASTLHFNIYTDQKDSPGKVILVDTGSGMNNEALKAFFVYGQSEWQAKRHKGRNGKGSKYMLWHAESLTVRTKCAKESLVKTFTLNLEGWLRQTLTGETVTIEIDSEVGSHEFDQPRGSFTLVEIRPKPDKAAFFSEQHLLENLADLLSPQYADRVFVNGKNLSSRDVTFFQDQMTVPALGDVRVYIYQPTSVKYRNGVRIDELQVGSIGPVMEFRSFVKNLTPAMRAKIPVAFFDRSICGLIEVEGFNEWREGASREFREELFHSPEIEIFVEYLSDILGPKISKEFGLESTEIQDKERKNFEILRQMTENAFGKITPDQPAAKDRKPTPHSKEFSVSPWTVTMVPGETQEFEAKGKPGQIFEWDGSGIPGAEWSVDADGGQRIRLVIGKAAAFDPNEQYRLIVKESTSGATREILIKIASCHELTIIPRSGSQFVNELATFRAINVPKGTATLLWSVDPAEAGEFVKNKGLEHIGLALKRPGKCVINARDPLNPLVKAASEFYVKEKRLADEPPKSETPCIRLEDTMVEIRTFASPDFSMQGTVEEKSENRIVFHLNIQHPKYAATLKSSESAWREYILGLAAWYYIMFFRALKTDMSDEEKAHLFSSMMAKLA